MWQRAEYCDHNWSTFAVGLRPQLEHWARSKKQAGRHLPPRVYSSKNTFEALRCSCFIEPVLWPGLQWVPGLFRPAENLVDTFWSYRKCLIYNRDFFTQKETWAKNSLKIDSSKFHKRIVLLCYNEDVYQKLGRLRTSKSKNKIRSFFASIFCWKFRCSNQHLATCTVSIGTLLKIVVLLRLNSNLDFFCPIC